MAESEFNPFHETMTHAETILELLSAGADDSVAISAPGRLPLTYGRLRAFLGETLSATAWIGLGCVVAGVAAMTIPARKAATAAEAT